MEIYRGSTALEELNVTDGLLKTINKLILSDFIRSYIVEEQEEEEEEGVQGQRSGGHSASC